MHANGARTERELSANGVQTERKRSAIMGYLSGLGSVTYQNHGAVEHKNSMIWHGKDGVFGVMFGKEIPFVPLRK